MKVTYNTQKNAYQVIYKDKLAELQGKPLYARKQFSAGKSVPSIRERKERIKELEYWAREQEEKSELAASEKNIELDNSEKPILALDFLQNIGGDDLATSTVAKTRNEAKLCLKDFISFLQKKYPEIYLHEINKKIALEFLGTMTAQKRTFAYKKKRWLRLGYVFNMVRSKNEDSDLKYRNPFYSLKIDKITEEEPINHKKTFSSDLVKVLLKEALEFNYTKTREQAKAYKFQRWAMLYLLALTGIRPKDIVLLKWQQINFETRTIKFLHYKTAKKGISTVIYMTPHLMELFTQLKELHKEFKPMHKDFVFSFHTSSTTKNIETYLYTANMGALTNFFKVFREKHGLTEQVVLNGKSIYFYCVYSLRATVGTVLTWANFNQNSIDYLQGHAPSNTTARFYLNHEANPKAATAGMVNYLAFNFLQQPLGEVGLKCAFDDGLLERREADKENEINEEIRYAKDGTSLLVLKLNQKIEEEHRQRDELIKQHGAEMADFLSKH